jgi:glycosyltransferase involved in cell wall biosynthesis
LIWLRAFHAFYNPQMAVRVLDQLCTVFTDVHLTMIGPDKGDGALQETRSLIKACRLETNVEVVLGIPKSQVPRYLDRADIFLNTTNVDNAPISVLEALACGLCVVSTNVGGIPYLLDDEKNALLVPRDHAPAMVDAILGCLMEPELAARLSSSARCKAEQFDWAVILPRWEKLFQEIVTA